MPSTVVIPTTSGIRAPRPRKKISDSRISSGKAIISARPRSSVTVLPICMSATDEPPTVTSSCPSKVVQDRLGDVLVGGVRRQGGEDQDLGPVVGDQRAGIAAGGRRGHDLGDAGLGRDASVTCWTRSASAGSPSGVSTTTTMPGARLGAGRGLDPVDGPDGVGVVAGEAAGGVEGAGERPTEEPGDEHEQEHREQAASGWLLRKRDTRPEARRAVGSGSGVGAERGGRVWFVMPRLSAEEAPSVVVLGESLPRAVAGGVLPGRYAPRRTVCWWHPPPGAAAGPARPTPARRSWPGADAFAAHGYAGTSVRAVATAAGVDAALVHHYFGTKDDLFLAALQAPVDPRQVLLPVAEGGIDGAGERLLRTFLSVWDDEATRLPLLTLVRSVFEPGAPAPGPRRLHARWCWARSGGRSASTTPELPDVAGRLAADGHRAGALRRRGRAAGLRPPTTQLVAAYAPTLQRYLDGPLALALCQFPMRSSGNNSSHGE